MGMREQQLAKQTMAVSRNYHILAFGEVFKPRSLPSNVPFVVFLTLCCTWPTFLKACAMLTNSNAQFSPVGSKVIEMRLTDIHCDYIHLITH